MSDAAISVGGGGGSAVATPALDWVVETLWGMPASGARSGRRRDGRSGDTFAVLPSAAHPRLLVPLGSRRAASHALREYTPGRPGIRIAKSLLTMGIRSGIAQPLLRDRVHVTVAGHVEQAQLRHVLLKEHLQEIFGRRDLEIAVTFDAPRPHCKPTLQILSRDGTSLGFAKVGWNDLTRPLVVNEARALARLEQRSSRLREFDVPKLIHAGRWRELEILIVAPVSFGSRRRFLGLPPVAATDEVASLSRTERMPLVASSWWTHTRQRVIATALTTKGSTARLGPVTDEIGQRFGEVVLDFGSWHGDWVPWNMGRHRGRLYVWDWERSGELAPRGLDGIHFDYQAELGLRGTPPAPALDATLRRSEGLLPELNVPAAHGRLLLCLHLLEMALRFDEARVAGVETADPKYLRVLQTLLNGYGEEAA